MVSRNYDLSQTPSDSILIFPDVPASPPSAGSFLGAVTSSLKLAQLGFFAPGTVYVPVAGGTMTGPLILSQDPVVPLGASTKRYTDTMLPLAGGQMAGPLSLAGDPTQPLHASTKQYTDTKLALAGGTMTGLLTLSGDPTNALQAATRQYADTKLALAGGTLTGFLTLNADPTGLLHASTKQYTDTKVAGVTAGLGTMAFQNANAVAITGGSESGLATVGFSDGSQIKPGNITPDTGPWEIEDVSGNIATFLDAANTWHGYGASFTTGTFATLATGTLSVTNPATFSTLNATTLTVAGDSWLGLTTQPDLVTIEAQDTTGNIIAGYSSDGYLNVVGIKATKGIQLAGSAVGGSSAASDALDVRSAPYSAAGDAVEGFCYATTAGTSLTIQSYAGNITLTQIDPATAELTIVPVANSGVAFQPYDVGKSLYLATGGGYTLQATIIRFYSSAVVRLATQAITPQSSVAATATWPCFQATDVGKNIVVDGQGQCQFWLSDVTKVPDSTWTYGQSVFITTIGTVISPTQVTLSAALPFTWTNVPTRLRWGTNDAAAVTAAGQAAYAQNKRKLYFSGDGRLYLVLGLVSTDGRLVQYVSPQGAEASAAVNGMLWVGDNARAFVCDGSGLPQPHHVAQVGSDGTKTSRKLFFGRGSFPRCAKLQTINLLITGDSQSVYAPQNQSQSWGQCHQFIQAFKKANPTKTVNIYNVGIGGATYAKLDDPAFTITNTFAQTAGWVNIPRPIVGTMPWYAFVTNINQTATSVAAPIVPDLVVIMDNGGNDSDSIDGPSMASFINRCRAGVHPDGNGPTDVVLMTDNLAVQAVSTIGNGGGVAAPNVGTARWAADYSAGLIRGSAITRGFACLDLAGQVQRAVYGMDHTRRALRMVPSFTATGSLTAPIGLPYRVLDFSYYLTFTGASDAAVWTAMQQLDVALSFQPGNRLMLRRGVNGNLWVGVATYGNTIPTVCTISSGSTALAVAAPTSVAVTYSAQTWLLLYVASGYAFTAADAGKQIILPTGDRARAQRNFIRSYVNPQNVTLHYQNYDGTSHIGEAATMTIGGVHFMAQDADAQSDLVIVYPDGTIFNTQIVGFTDQTHVTLRDPAPQAIAGVSTSVFLGRMGTKWFDTGLSVTGMTTTGQLGIDISRDTLIIGYKSATANALTQYVDILIERFGGTFYSAITPYASQQITLDHWYIDEHRPFMPQLTAWEVRGMKDNQDNNYYLGGVGGHPSSRIMTDVLDSFLVNQDLGTA